MQESESPDSVTLECLAITDPIDKQNIFVTYLFMTHEMKNNIKYLQPSHVASDDHFLERTVAVM